MKKGPLLAVITAVLVSQPVLSANDNDRANFEALCQSCHVAQGRPVVAPPAFAVQHHIKAEYPQREAFIEWVQQWVRSPNAEEALMPGAIRRFGVMPGFPYPQDRLRSAAAYLYDNAWQKPTWFDQHFQKEHGQQTRD